MYPKRYFSRRFFAPRYFPGAAAATVGGLYFPQINSDGIMTQRPYKSSLSFNTSVAELACGKRLTWGWRAMGMDLLPNVPLGAFNLNYPAITDAEVEVLSAFFTTMRARWKSFIFLNPHGNLVRDSEDFSNAVAWTAALSGDPGQPDPFGGTRARQLTLGTLTTTLLPLGEAAGIMLTGSVWVKGAPGNVITISFSDGSSTASTLYGSQWVRIEHHRVITGSSAVAMTISASSVNVTLFGAQCVPGPGAGGYLRTPGFYGYHPKCRFDTDSFQPKYIAPNHISLVLPIMEHN